MIATDVLLQASLLLVCIAWWIYGYRYRTHILWFGTLATLAFTGASLLSFRWQAAPVFALCLGITAVLIVGAIRERRVSSVPYFSGIFLAACSGLSVSLLYLFPVFALPEPSGSYQVGTQSFSIELDPAHADGDEVGSKRIFLRAWYPASVVSGAPQRYTDEAEAAIVYPSLAKAIGLPSFFFMHLTNVHTNSYENAVPAKVNSPVVFFNHGYASFLSQNTALMEHLASHGYTVFSLAHPDSGAAVVAGDGTVHEPSADWYAAMETLASAPPAEATRMRIIGETYSDRFDGLIGEIERAGSGKDIAAAQSARLWVIDSVNAVRALSLGQVPESMTDVIERADLARIAFVGMSFGGSTSAAICLELAICGAAINLDGTDYHYGGVDRDMPVPTLMVSSDWINAKREFGYAEDADLTYSPNDFSYERFENGGKNPNVTRLRVVGAKHLGLTDSALLFRGPLRGLLIGEVEGDRLIELTNDLVRSFLDQHLRSLPLDFPKEPLNRHTGILAPHSASGVERWWQSLTERRRNEMTQRLSNAREGLHRSAASVSFAPEMADGQ